MEDFALATDHQNASLLMNSLADSALPLPTAATHQQSSANESGRQEDTMFSENDEDVRQRPSLKLLLNRKSSQMF